MDGAKFKIDANGVRSIEDFAIVPYVNKGEHENFDFVGGDSFTDLANGKLKNRVDPSRIGRRVDFDFDYKKTPRTVQTINFYSMGQSPLPDPTLLGTIIANSDAFLDRLWNSGATKALDSEGRAIIYGSDKADSLSPETFSKRFYQFGVDPRLTTAMNTKGVALIGGAGADVLTGGANGDALYGGVGNDKLIGQAGFDIYYIKPGEGSDTISDSDGQGKIMFGGAAVTGAGKADYKLVGNQAQWSVGGGSVIYTLDTAQKRLVISGSTLGAGSKITVNDFDLTRAQGSGGIWASNLTIPKRWPCFLAGGAMCSASRASIPTVSLAGKPMLTKAAGRRSRSI
jgi:Ca2+-binding RTX toxin-like protein